MFRYEAVRKWINRILFQIEIGDDFETCDCPLTASIGKIKHHKECAPPKRNGNSNASDVLPKNLDQDNDSLYNFTTEKLMNTSKKETQPPVPITMSQRENIFGRNSSSFSFLDVIIADDFMVRIVKPNDPGSKEKDFPKTKNADADGLEVRKN